ncbi:hypothetical protein J517_3710 [Acinetobacter baumannii 118362]|uniref:Uncharacterized protein n=1 Tax=Acinetobacter baumannii EGD-HP18 TaxID=1358412 RepID=A0AAV3K275_ACIBA|nr:hypothetical protein N173_14025 [Acinetobacter baumannii EGD-HP18]EXA83725.1 hypothetical protein J517_3710 [Acinetobacter baumannii 118362]EXB78412.1 hypothetical protein J542_3766 [Acinetobacter baumannii 299505]EXE89361.1 hypothetical protein J591_1188 [Acinetobacter baumannii 532279]
MNHMTQGLAFVQSVALQKRVHLTPYIRFLDQLALIKLN